MARSARRPTLTAVPGVRVGHASTSDGRSGVSAILFDSVAPTVVDVRGGASGTFDTASLGLDATFGGRAALFFAGGSLFGLDAGRGLRRRVLEEGGGVRAFDNPNPIVPISGAILFDLPRRSAPLPDYEALGYSAARAASRRPVAIGRAGAGSGATVGKYRGRAHAAHGGVGSAARAVRGLGSVGVLAVVNSVGAIRDPSTGTWVAGPRDARGAVIPPGSADAEAAVRSSDPGTTLIAVATDVTLPRSMLQRIGVYAHDGLALAVTPAHTATDGDVVFVTTTGRKRPREREAFPGEHADRLGTATAGLVVEAILRAVRAKRPD